MSIVSDLRTLGSVEARIQEAIHAWQHRGMARPSLRDRILVIDHEIEQGLPISLKHQDLVAVYEGDGPIVLSNPHGFLGESAFTARPVSSPADYLTRYVTLATLLRSREARPSYVGLQIRRSYLELNKKPEEAYVDPRLASVYTGYYDELRRLLSRASSQHGAALLLDIHGFDPRSIPGPFDNEFERRLLECDCILGTDNRKTVKGTGLDFLLGVYFAEAGIRAYAPKFEPVDGERFGGGLITNSVLSIPDASILGVQMEIHRRHRETYEAANMFVGRLVRVLARTNDALGLFVSIAHTV